MLRFLYTVCDWLAGILAITSPITIFHWLFKVAGVAAAASFVSFLDPFFTPLNQSLDLFLHQPQLTYEGRQIPLTQGILACLMTIGFFAFHTAAQICRTMEEKLQVSRQAFVENRRLQKLEKEQKSRQKQIVTNRRIFAHIHYDFAGYREGATAFEHSSDQAAAKVLERLPDAMNLEFDNLNNALQYAIATSRKILSHYAVLRPMDYQPPFRMSLHALEVQTSLSECIRKTAKLIAYAGPNQVVFSQDIKALIEAQGLGMEYQFQSIGIYALPEGQQEMFRLFSNRR